MPSRDIHGVAGAATLTIRVPGDGATIQIGLDTASSGDTVIVAPGTYTGIWQQRS